MTALEVNADLAKLAEAHSKVTIKVLRRNVERNFAVVYANLRFLTPELSNIRAWCLEHAGSGYFRIEIYPIGASKKQAYARLEFRARRLIQDAKFTYELVATEVAANQESEEV